MAKANQQGKTTTAERGTAERGAPPEHLVRMIGGQPNIDVEQRIVEFTVCTRALARDGGIVVPEGIIRKFYEQNPVVGIRHMLASCDTPRPLVAGRALSLETTPQGLVSRCQFADTELGREWAYLYGVNPAKEVYMRAVSFGWSILKSETWTLAEARTYLGSAWDEESVPQWCRRYDEVWVSQKSEMHEYSLVEVGADRNALSRALEAGVRTAGEIIVRIDLDQARQELALIKEEQGDSQRRMAKLEQDMKAIARDGADAAGNGDSSAILQEARALVASLGIRNAIQELKAIRSN